MLGDEKCPSLRGKVPLLDPLQRLPVLSFPLTSPLRTCVDFERGRIATRPQPLRCGASHTAPFGERNRERIRQRIYKSSDTRGDTAQTSSAIYTTSLGDTVEPLGSVTVGRIVSLLPLHPKDSGWKSRNSRRDRRVRKRKRLSEDRTNEASWRTTCKLDRKAIDFLTLR